MLVYLAIIKHCYGCDVSLHQTERDAKIAVEKWAREYWSVDGPLDKVRPDDPAQLAQDYFEASGETWWIEEHEIPWLSRDTQER